MPAHWAQELQFSPVCLHQRQADWGGSFHFHTSETKYKPPATCLSGLPNPCLSLPTKWSFHNRPTGLHSVSISFGSGFCLTQHKHDNHWGTSVDLNQLNAPPRRKVSRLSYCPKLEAALDSRESKVRTGHCPWPFPHPKWKKLPQWQGHTLERKWSPPENYFVCLKQ